ncbi:MAG: hypothetical protein AMXMBFR7_02830 [Planctomycetota bacterium]
MAGDALKHSESSGSTRLVPPGAPELNGASASALLLEARLSARRKRTARRRGLLAALGVAALCALGWWLGSARPEAGTWYKVERKTLLLTQHELGEVVARLETPVLSTFSGEVVWKIEEGTNVHAGEPIVRFDATRAKDDLSEREKDLFDKEQNVQQVRRDAEAVAERYALELSRRAAALELAQIARAETYEHPTADERLTADLDLRSAELKHSKVLSDYLSHEDLNRAGFVTEAVLKQKRLAWAREKAELAKAKILHQLTLAGSSRDSKRLADLAVAEAELNLKLGEFERDADVAIAKADLDLAEVELADFKLGLERKRRELEQAEVGAPVGGRVAFVDVWKGSDTLSPIQVGETRNRGQDLAKMVDTAGLRVRVLASEADVLKLKVGQRAEVRLPAYPQRLYKARVAEIAVVATDKNVALTRLALQKSGEAFVNVVSVWLDFDDLTEADRQAMRLGFTAEAEIEWGRVESAPAIPWGAVEYGPAGAAYVRVRGGLGGNERRAVELGRGNAFFVEVRSGLSEGEDVRVPRHALPPEAQGANAGPHEENRS